MKHFTSVHDVEDLSELVFDALHYKRNPWCDKHLGEAFTLGLIFLNTSLRTRLSVQKAAHHLGMKVMVINVDQDSWAIEYEDDVIMSGKSVEHIREAAAVIGVYCDIVGVRCFPDLMNRESDYNENILSKFIQYSGRPVISLESATRHPLQSFADLLTIKEHTQPGKKPKVVLTWAPHIKPLPQAVPNSFAEWVLAAGLDLTIVQPKGLELCSSFTAGATILYDQNEALKDADFVYVKNWSGYEPYGKTLFNMPDWMLTEEKHKLTNQAKIMHCLPVRRNLELGAALLDGPHSVVLQQADNRVFATQAVLKHIVLHR